MAFYLKVVKKLSRNGAHMIFNNKNVADRLYLHPYQFLIGVMLI